MRLFACWIGVLLVTGAGVAVPDAGAQATPREHPALVAAPPSLWQSDPRPADAWWAPDKAKHVAFSFLWTLSTQYVLVDKVGWSNQKALPASAGITVTIGLSKEVYDWQYGSTRRFSKKDLVANAVGILAAVGVILL